MDRKILPGFVENIATPADIDRTELPKILLMQIEELQFEIDELLRHLGQTDRANAPWESNDSLTKLQQLKDASAKIAKAVK